MSKPKKNDTPMGHWQHSARQTQAHTGATAPGKVTQSKMRAPELCNRPDTAASGIDSLARRPHR